MYMRCALHACLNTRSQQETNKKKNVMGHTIRRSPMFSSESVQGGTENGLFNSTDSGGKEAKESEAGNFI